MADEPGGWELQRALVQIREDVRDGFAQSNARLDKLVTAEAFAAEQKRVDGLHQQLSEAITRVAAESVADLAEEKQARIDGDKAQQATLDKLASLLKWVWATTVLPVVLFAVTMYMNRGA